MREIKKDDLEILGFKIESEGFDYALTEYSGGFEGTEIWKEIQEYKRAKEALENKLDGLMEKFGIDYHD